MVEIKSGGDRMKRRVIFVIIGLILALFLLVNCSIPSQKVRKQNRESWKLALIEEPIEKVIEVWGIQQAKFD